VLSDDDSAIQVFVNGLWIGVHRDPTMLVSALRGMRRQVDINTEVGAHFQHYLGLHKLLLQWLLLAMPFLKKALPAAAAAAEEVPF